MKRFLIWSYLCLAFCFLLLSIMIGCTPAQLAQVDKSVGGTAYATSQPTTQKVLLDIGVHGTQDAAVIATATGTPWGTIAGVVLGLIGAGLGAYQTSSANTANNKATILSNTIAAAAPGVAQLVKQVTDNQSLATDITTVAQIAPAVLAIASHPAAVAVPAQAVAAGPSVSGLSGGVVT